jgi:hypothetical protein
VEGSSCSADLTLTFPDESTTTLDGCTDWNFVASMEYDPDDPPEVIDFTFTLGGTTEADFDCRVELVQEGVCGEGYYDQRDATGTTTMVLMDCSGVSDEYESTFDGSEGYLRIDTLDAGSTTGSFAGQPLSTTLEGHLHVWSSEGIELEGDVALTLTQLAGDGEEQTDCVVSNGDWDSDGDLDPNFDGDDCDDSDASLNQDDSDIDEYSSCDDDCDDNDATAYPGAASQEPTLCTHDADEDGWGDADAVSPLDAGTDCDDNDADAYVGAASQEPTLCTHDADEDGWGDADAVSPLDAGTDCDDNDADAYVGVAGKEPTLCTHDADGDGWGDIAAVSPLNAGTDCDDNDWRAYVGAASQEPTLCTPDADWDGWGDADAVSPLDA